MYTPEVRCILVGHVGARQAASAGTASSPGCRELAASGGGGRQNRARGRAAAGSLALREASRVGGQWGCLDARSLAW